MTEDTEENILQKLSLRLQQRKILTISLWIGVVFGAFWLVEIDNVLSMVSVTYNNPLQLFTIAIFCYTVCYPTCFIFKNIKPILNWTYKKPQSVLEKSLKDFSDPMGLHYILFSVLTTSFVGLLLISVQPTTIIENIPYAELIVPADESVNKSTAYHQLSSHYVTYALVVASGAILLFILKLAHLKKIPLQEKIFPGSKSLLIFLYITPIIVVFSLLEPKHFGLWEVARWAFANTLVGIIPAIMFSLMGHYFHKKM